MSVFGRARHCSRPEPLHYFQLQKRILKNRRESEQSHNKTRLLFTKSQFQGKEALLGKRVGQKIIILKMPNSSLAFSCCKNKLSCSTVKFSIDFIVSFLKEASSQSVSQDIPGILSSVEATRCGCNVGTVSFETTELGISGTIPEIFVAFSTAFTSPCFSAFSGGIWMTTSV